MGLPKKFPSKAVATAFDAVHRSEIGSISARYIPINWKVTPGKTFAALKKLYEGVMYSFEQFTGEKPPEEEQRRISIFKDWLHKAAQTNNKWYLRNVFTPSGLLSQYQKIMNSMALDAPALESGQTENQRVKELIKSI